MRKETAALVALFGGLQIATLLIILIAGSLLYRPLVSLPGLVLGLVVVACGMAWGNRNLPVPLGSVRLFLLPLGYAAMTLGLVEMLALRKPNLRGFFVIAAGIVAFIVVALDSSRRKRARGTTSNAG